jgi:AraC-like DNA-binding protein
LHQGSWREDANNRSALRDSRHWACCRRWLRACAGLTDHVATDLEELGIRVVARIIEEHSEGPLTLSRLANESGLILYHFLRVFQQITGVTLHQYLLHKLDNREHRQHDD